MSAVSSRELSARSISHRAWTLVLPALLGVVGSVALVLVLQSRERGVIEVQFDQRAHDRVSAIERELQASVTQIDSIARLFMASDTVTRNEFKVFVTPILEREPSFRALGYDVLVRDAERAAHEVRIRDQGYPAYRITEQAADGSLVPAARRQEYVAVSYLEPLIGNEAALGYDIASEAARREALDRARDSGQPAITEAVVLVQEVDDRLGVLICVPVFPGPTPATVAERRRRLQGYAVGVIRVDDLVSHALAGLQPVGVHLRVVDVSDPGRRPTLALHRSRAMPPDAGRVTEAAFGSPYTRRYAIEIGGRRWAVEATPTAAFVEGRTTWTPVGFLLGGLLMTATVTLYLVRQAAATTRLRSAVLAREHAEERRASLGRVLDESHEEFYVFDAETLRLLHVNRGARDNLGYSMDELRSMTALDLATSMTSAALAALLQPLRDGVRQRTMLTTVHRRRDGSLYDVEAHLQMTSFDGAPALVAVVLDITERKRMEERQRQSQRLEALGTLAGGTAHDVNNLLTAIMGYTELTLAGMSPGDGAREYMGEVIRATERARDVVRQILTFSRRKPIETHTIDLREVAEEALQLVGPSLPADITVRAELACDCCIRGDSSQIHQVLVNLCTNAAHAMRERGGTLAVTVAAVDLDAAEAARLGDMNSGDHARIDVCDDGVGIRPEIRERIFDPFFTTKEPGEGTGMGLAVAHGIVRAHGGTVRVASEVGRGTTVSVYLPRVETPLRAIPVAETVHEIRGERIVVVDDEPSIVRLLVETLSRMGYVVEGHRTGSAALEAIRRADGAIDLVITDFSMPQMSGTTLARTLARLAPGLPVILVSGYGDLIDQGEIRSSGVRALLTKPLRQSELRRAIRRALDRAKPRTPR